MHACLPCAPFLACTDGEVASRFVKMQLHAFHMDIIKSDDWSFSPRSSVEELTRGEAARCCADRDASMTCAVSGRVQFVVN